MTAALPKKSGIYRISVALPDGTNRFYIGQSAHLAKRWNRHLADLRKGKHWNLGLQIDFSKYGEAATRFEVVLICEPTREMLAFYEQLVVTHSEKDRLYNIRIQCVISALGTTASPERKAKISRALKGIRRSDETKAAVSRAQAWKHTPEGKAKMSAAAKGRRATLEQKLARSVALKAKFHFTPKSYEKGAATREMNRLVLKKNTAWVLYG